MFIDREIENIKKIIIDENPIIKERLKSIEHSNSELTLLQAENKLGKLTLALLAIHTLLLATSIEGFLNFRNLIFLICFASTAGNLLFERRIQKELRIFSLILTCLLMNLIIIRILPIWVNTIVLGLTQICLSRLAVNSYFMWSNAITLFLELLLMEDLGLIFIRCFIAGLMIYYEDILQTKRFDFILLAITFTKEKENYLNIIDKMNSGLVSIKNQEVTFSNEMFNKINLNCFSKSSKNLFSNERSSIDLVKNMSASYPDTFYKLSRPLTDIKYCSSVPKVNEFILEDDYNKQTAEFLKSDLSSSPKFMNNIDCSSNNEAKNLINQKSNTLQREIWENCVNSEYKYKRMINDYEIFLFLNELVEKIKDFNNELDSIPELRNICKLPSPFKLNSAQIRTKSVNKSDLSYKTIQSVSGEHKSSKAEQIIDFCYRRKSSKDLPFIEEFFLLGVCEITTIKNDYDFFSFKKDRDNKDKELPIIGEKEIKYLELYIRYTKSNDNVQFLINDITRMKQEEKSKAEIKYKSLFLAKIAHEFKNPIITISSLCKQQNEQIENKLEIAENSSLCSDEDVSMNSCSNSDSESKHIWMNRRTGSLSPPGPNKLNFKKRNTEILAKKEILNLSQIKEIDENETEKVYHRSISLNNTVLVNPKHDCMYQNKRSAEIEYKKFNNPLFPTNKESKQEFERVGRFNSLGENTIKPKIKSTTNIKNRPKCQLNLDNIEEIQNLDLQKIPQVNLEDDDSKTNNRFSKSSFEKRPENKKSSMSKYEEKAQFSKNHEINNFIISLCDYLFILIEDLNYFSKMQNAATSPKKAKGLAIGCRKSDVEIVPIIQFCFDIFKYRQKNDPNKVNLRIETEYDSGLPRKIHSNETRLKQVIINLMSNAYKFTKCGEVKIKVQNIYEQKSVRSLTQRYLRISVIDTGMGMSDDEIQNLFQPFGLIDRHQNLNIHGSGLGLMVVKEILRDLNSEIKVESILEVGTTFWFDIQVESRIDTSSNVSRLPRLDIDREEKGKQSSANISAFAERLTINNINNFIFTNNDTQDNSIPTKIPGLNYHNASNKLNIENSSIINRQSSFSPYVNQNSFDKSMSNQHFTESVTNLLTYTTFLKDENDNILIRCKNHDDENQHEKEIIMVKNVSDLDDYCNYNENELAEVSNSEGHIFVENDENLKKIISTVKLYIILTLFR